MLQKLEYLIQTRKNQALLAVADFLVKEQNSILDANKIDIENGKKNHMPEGMLDRLLLTEARIAQIAEGLQQVAALDDPIGEVLGMKKKTKRTYDWSETSIAWRCRNYL